MTSANECDFILNTSIKIFRNVDKVPFVSCFCADDAEDIELSVRSVCNSLWDEDKYTAFSLNNTEPCDLAYWCEEHFIKLNTDKTNHVRTIFANNTAETEIITNETEHLLVHSLCNGYNIDKVFSNAAEAVNALSKRIPFATSDKYGFVTANPHYVGTAIKAEVLIHLPALTFAKQIDKLAQELVGKGAIIKGFCTDCNGNANGALYYITNMFTLGITEQETLKYLEAAVQCAVDAEADCREHIMGNDAHSVYDLVWRSVGTIALSYSLELNEFLTAISSVRFGAENGILKIDTELADDMFMRGLTAHVDRYKKINDIEQQASDETRARIMRESMSPILKKLL